VSLSVSSDGGLSVQKKGFATLSAVQKANEEELVKERV
jgi:hypothetical protein